MKNKVLLVYPGGFGSIFPELPMSLLYLSWALKKKGYYVEILDTRLRSYKEVKDKDYLFVGISSMTGLMIKEGLKVATHIRELNSQIPIVWGGVHVTLLPEQSLINPYVDIVVRGEGELTIQELSERLQNNESLSGVKGISFKKGNEVIANPDREVMDLNKIDTELPYELFDMNGYSFTAFPLHTSRGCPYRCGFCYNTVFNKRRWRYKTADKVLNEIEYAVKKFGISRISFTWEDEFFINVKRVRDVCTGILERGIDIKWDSFCRFNSFQMVDDDLLELIEKSGCATLSFGGESGSQRILDEVVKKDIKLEQIIKTTERLSKTNIRQIVSFMSCLPTETDEDMELTHKLMDRLVKINNNIYLNGIYLYTPYPGTPLFERIVKDYIYEAPNSLEKWSEYGIYRNVGIKWHPNDYIKKSKTISILTRFPFYKNKFTLKDVEKIVGGTRFSKFPYNVIYYLLTKLAIYRWRYKFFKYPIEWILLEKILERLRGFV